MVDVLVPVALNQTYSYRVPRGMELTAGDVVAQTASQCFDISVWQFLAPLLRGARVHIVPDDVAHDPTALLYHLDEAGITIVEPVPAVLQGLLTVEGSVPALAGLRWALPTGKSGVVPEARNRCPPGCPGSCLDSSQPFGLSARA